MNPKFIATAKDGKVEWQPNQGKYVSNYLRTLEGKKIVVEIKEWKSQRTLPQNAYLHGIVFKTIGDHLGYTVEEIKEALKDKFASKIDDMGLKIVEPTHKMSNERMSKFIEDCCRFAAQELDIYVEPPQER